jgi:hypothetical protein
MDLVHFPCSQRGADPGEHRPITEKGILRRVSISIIKKLLTHNKEANTGERLLLESIEKKA